jgi:hypothetical protein
MNNSGHTEQLIWPFALLLWEIARGNQTLLGGAFVIAWSGNRNEPIGESYGNVPSDEAVRCVFESNVHPRMRPGTEFS